MLHYKEITKLLETLNIPIATSNKQKSYLNIECGFDIETTSYIYNGKKSAFMYIWQFGIGYGNPVYYGRTWEEFIDLIDILRTYLNLNNDLLLPIYIHNMSYEFQFIKPYFQWLSVFAIDERKPIRAEILGIEFRDSYILSGFSLANTARNLAKHKIQKMEGDLDYSLVRTHATPLTEKEIKYCEEDINIILAYINEQIEHSGDVTKIPMTNTGRVRSFVRNRCYYENSKGEKVGKGYYSRYRKIMEDLTLDVETYLQLKTAFMGGFTHANANYSGKLLHNVSSIDFTSSYPAVMISEKFPMSRFSKEEVKSLEHFEEMAKTHALIFDMRFTNLRPKIEQENYISESKCRNIVKAKINNGRVSEAESITATLTEVDYHIMKQAYTWDKVEISNLKSAMKGYLPKPIIESILSLYQDKTVLKDVEGMEVEYMLSKGMLNSIYGMSVTDIVKDKNVYINDRWELEKVDVAEEIESYNSSRNRFLFYAWGLWVTAYARKNLWTGIIAVGNDYVYSDTDSLKILNYEKHKKYINWFDNQIIKKMLKMCEYYNIDKKLLNPKTKEGVEKMIGVWDFEGTYQNFKTLGAKRYLTDENGKLSITVAGLSKQNGLQYLIEKAGGDNLKVFELFNDNLHIPADRTGKMTHTYIDEPDDLLITDYLNRKTHVRTLSGVHLESCDFTLSIADEYKTFLENLSKGYIYKGLNFI